MRKKTFGGLLFHIFSKVTELVVLVLNPLDALGDEQVIEMKVVFPNIENDKLRVLNTSSGFGKADRDFDKS